MNINPTHMKYIEWRDPKGLHEDTKNCISQLRFINDELDFLSHLIKEHTLELISGEIFERSKPIVSKLISLQKELNPLIAEVEIHRNGLQILMDGIDVKEKLQDYKVEHYKLMFEAVSFGSEFKKLKKRIFELITILMKLGKQKKLRNQIEKQ